jgi:hypothetical protein
MTRARHDLLGETKPAAASGSAGRPAAKAPLDGGQKVKLVIALVILAAAGGLILYQLGAFGLFGSGSGVAATAAAAGGAGGADADPDLDPDTGQPLPPQPKFSRTAQPAK